MTAVTTSYPIAPDGQRPLRRVHRWARSLLQRRLADLDGAALRLHDRDGTHALGGASSDGVDITVHHGRFYRRAVTGGGLGVAASYLDGDWDCDDLTSLFRAMVRQIQSTDRVNNGLARFGQAFARLYHAFRRNTLGGSRRNIHDHYDLGNAFFEQFLDSTMSYSCGVYPSPTSSLQDASVEKMDRLCRMLDLKPDDHLIEIGTGWGGLAIHAATRYGCRVTTTTISTEQHRYAQQCVDDAGLNDRVTLLQRDYRDLTGRFDKLVSVEMIEAVGHNYLPTYFQHCADLLKPDGRMAIQAITMPDHRYERYRRSADFIQRYVFPGSCVPSMAAMTNAIAKSCDLRLVACSDIGPHYARTLRDWRQRFFANAERVRELGYPERLLRLWNYYLCYCEAGFAERYTGTSQMLLAKPGCRADWPTDARADRGGVQA